MAKNKGNVIDCIKSISSHTRPNVIKMILGTQTNLTELEEAFSYRFSIVKEEADLAVEQLQKIKEIAASRGYKDITKILEEELEYGHDF